MVNCTVRKQAYVIQPEHIELHIELLPIGEIPFDELAKDAASKTDAVANYAAATFGTRGANVITPEDKKAAKAAEQAEKERVARMIREGQARSLAGFEKALERAEAGKDPREIADAKLALDRVKARIRANEA